MKLFILGLITLTLSSELYAQARGPRYNPNPNRSEHRPDPGPRYNPRPGNNRNDRNDRRNDNRYDRPYRPGPVVVVRPRYVPNNRSTRVIRTTRRAPITWSYGFGYTCGTFGDLRLNGRLIHDFRFSSDCYEALSDIRIYGDFCDNEDLYDQSGYLEAQFTFNYECRDALGWYY